LDLYYGELVMEILNRAEDGLKRSYSVLLPKEELDAAIIARLREIAKKVRLDGFRPGKAPLDVLKRLYGDSAIAEAKKQAVSDAVKGVFKDEKLTLSLNYTTEIVRDENDELEFALKFELIPSCELKDFSGIEIIKRNAEINDAEVDETLESLRKERKKWIEDESGEEIKIGQKVSVYLVLQNPDKKLKNAAANDVDIIIGDEFILEDFWKPLIGMKVEEKTEFSVSYPEKIAEKALAGKTVRYEATVKKVFNPSEYELDDEFAKSIGFDDLEKAKEWAKSRVVSKYDHMTRDIMRRDLLDKMSDMYDFDVPQNMAEIEDRVISVQIEEEAKKLGKEFTPHIKEECRGIAERRVRLGFVIAEIAKKEKISVSRDEIYRAIKDIASMYPGQEKAVFERYSQGNAIQSVIGPILEDKVIGFLLGKVQIKEEKISVAELVALDEETFDFFKDEDELGAEKSKSDEGGKKKKSGGKKKADESSEKIKEEEV
jgi:trigger factor